MPPAFPPASARQVEFQLETILKRRHTSGSTSRLRVRGVKGRRYHCCCCVVTANTFLSSSTIAQGDVAVGVEVGAKVGAGVGVDDRTSRPWGAAAVPFGPEIWCEHVRSANFQVAFLEKPSR